MNGRNCWKGKGNRHILLNNKQLLYRHNKVILGQDERFIEKIKIVILTTSFTEGRVGGGGGGGKRGIYIGVSKNLLEF